MPNTIHVARGLPEPLSCVLFDDPEVALGLDESGDELAVCACYPDGHEHMFPFVADDS
jgi:hypothetical protein